MAALSALRLRDRRSAGRASNKGRGSAASARLVAACLLGCTVGLSGCSLTPSEEDPTQVKLNDLDTRVVRIERVISNQSLLDLAKQLEDSQTEIRQLRGRIEVLENSNEALKKQQRDLYADLDKRISGGGGAGSAILPAGTGQPAGAAASGGAGPGGAGTASPAVSPEQTAYNAAFDALKTSNYAGAISGFKDFITNYPHSDLLDNARYWLGEAYYVTRDFPSAATAFQSVVQNSPNSRKAPDAMLKLAYTLQEQKQITDAKATLLQVTQRYPGTDAARLANERLQHLPADAR